MLSMFHMFKLGECCCTLAVMIIVVGNNFLQIPNQMLNLRFTDAFSHLTINQNGTLMATVCMQDKSVKIFDIPNFDMINMLSTEFAPRTAAWIHQG